MSTKSRGINWERDIVKEMRVRGWIALRSSASLSPFDVVAIHLKRREVKFIQAKCGKKRITGKELDKILSYKAFDGEFKVSFELWQKVISKTNTPDEILKD